MQLAETTRDMKANTMWKSRSQSDCCQMKKNVAVKYKGRRWKTL